MLGTCWIKIHLVFKAACAVKHISCSSTFVSDNFLGLQFENIWKFKVQLEQTFRADNLCFSLNVFSLALLRQHCGPSNSIFWVSVSLWVHAWFYFNKLKLLISSSRLRQYIIYLEQVFCVSYGLIPVSFLYFHEHIFIKAELLHKVLTVFPDYPGKLICPMLPPPCPLCALFSGGTLQIPLCVPFPQRSSVYMWTWTRRALGSWWWTNMPGMLSYVISCSLAWCFFCF